MTRVPIPLSVRRAGRSTWGSSTGNIFGAFTGMFLGAALCVGVKTGFAHLLKQMPMWQQLAILVASALLFMVFGLVVGKSLKKR